MSHNTNFLLIYLAKDVTIWHNNAYSVLITSGVANHQYYFGIKGKVKFIQNL